MVCGLSRGVCLPRKQYPQGGLWRPWNICGRLNDFWNGRRDSVQRRGPWLVPVGRAGRRTGENHGPVRTWGEGRVGAGG